jgi:tRNA nucleotidyltransferase (CCA-adding enzyme)
MSDYVYMLESHLSPDQNRVVEEVQTAAAQAGVNLFLTGGAMRDMLAGLRIRDLDFVIEGNALKVAKSIGERTGALTVSADENRKSAELVFASGVTAQVSMSRQEKYTRTGAKPQVSAASNAIALSLNKASRGLLLDPMNGLADIERHELRAISTYGFYDDPSRLLRLIRFRVRLGFTVEERTRMQVANAREAEVEKLIPARVLGDELKRISMEDSPSEILKALDEAGLLELFSPGLTGPKLNLAGIVRFEKNSKLLPDDARSRAARFGPFLYALTEKFTIKEKQGLIKATDMQKAELEPWQKLDARAKKLETSLRAARVKKAAHVYQIMTAAAPDEILFQLYHSTFKPVQERMRNYYQKYLPLLQEITPEEWATVEGKPGTPKYNKARDAFIASRLDRKVKKPVIPEVAPAPPPPGPPPSSWSTPETAMARRGRQG